MSGVPEVQSGLLVDRLDQFPPVDDVDVVHLHRRHEVGILDEDILRLRVASLRDDPCLEVDVVLFRIGFIEWSHQ